VRNLARVFVRTWSVERAFQITNVARGNPDGDAWKQVSAARFFRDILCATIVKIYYAHPLAWNEIGYNGPSSPRGHIRKWEGGVDSWEAQEK